MWRSTRAQSSSSVQPFFRSSSATSPDTYSRAYLSATRATAEGGTAAGTDQVIALTVPDLRRPLSGSIAHAYLISTVGDRCFDTINPLASADHRLK